MSRRNSIGVGEKLDVFLKKKSKNYSSRLMRTEKEKSGTWRSHWGGILRGSISIGLLNRCLATKGHWY